MTDRRLRLLVAAGMVVVIPESKLPPQVERMADGPSIPFDKRWWPTDADTADAARCVTDVSCLPVGKVALCCLVREVFGDPFGRKVRCRHCRGKGDVRSGQIYSSRWDREVCGVCDGTGNVLSGITTPRWAVGGVRQVLGAWPDPRRVP